MNWKEQLKKHETNKDWKPAFEVLENAIEKNPSDVDAYLSMNYLLMNLLVEEEYDKNQHDYYAGLLKKYFLESYSKFSNNPEYLFFIGMIACMSEWYFGIEIQEAEKMMKEALNHEPNNPIYKWAYYGALDMRNADNRLKVIPYIEEIRKKDVETLLKSKGALGEYIFEIIANWSNRYAVQN